MPHGDRQIVHQRRGGADHRPVIERLAQRHLDGDAHDLEQEDRCLVTLEPGGQAVRLGCDHRNYPAHVGIAAETLASLAGDLSAP